MAGQVEDDTVIKWTRKVKKETTCKMTLDMTIRSFKLLLNFVVFVIVVCFWWTLCLPVILTLALLFYLVMMLVKLIQFCTSCFIRKYSFLTPSEIVLMENTNGCCIQCVMQLNGVLDIQRLRDRIRETIIPARTRKGTLLYPRLTQILYFSEGLYEWQDYINFCVEDHVTQETVDLKTVYDIENYISITSTKPLSREKPCWEIKSISFQTGSLLLIRLHPLLINGRTAVDILCSFLADSFCKYRPPSHNSFEDSFQKLVNFSLFAPFLLFQAWRGKSEHKHCKKYMYVAPLETEVQENDERLKQIAWSEEIHLPSLIHCKSVARTSLNDVILAAIAGSFRKVVKNNDLQSCEHIPVKFILNGNKNWRHHTIDKRVNIRENISCLPISTEGAVPCLWLIRATMINLRSSAIPILSHYFISVLSIFSRLTLPLRFLRHRNRPTFCSYTSLSGPTATLYVFGKRVENIRLWYPVTKDASMSVTTFTYANELRIGVETWQKSGIDIKEFVKEFKNQMNIFITLLGHRRVPMQQRRVDDDEDDEDDLEDVNPGDVYDASTSDHHKLSFQRSRQVHASQDDFNVRIPTISHPDAVSTSSLQMASSADNTDRPPTPKNTKEFLYEVSFSANGGSDTVNVPVSSSPRASVELDVRFQFSPAVERRNSGNNLL